MAPGAHQKAFIGAPRVRFGAYVSCLGALGGAKWHLLVALGLIWGAPGWQIGDFWAPLAPQSGHENCVFGKFVCGGRNCLISRTVCDGTFNFEQNTAFFGFVIV